MQEFLHEHKTFTEPKLVSKKPYQRIKKVQQEIYCACGCGQKLFKYDSSWRERNSILGHLNKSKITFQKIKEYFEKGYSRQEIKDIEHVSTETINHILKENNYIPLDGRHGNRFKEKVATFNKTSKDYSYAVGNKNWNYKSIKKNKEGYVLENARNHPYAIMGKNKLIMKHRLIMENYLKENDPTNKWLVEINGEKFLSKKCSVHHINHIRDDNRIENLQVMSISEHSKLHHIDRYKARMEKKLCLA